MSRLSFLLLLASCTGGIECFLRAALALYVFQERGLISLAVQGDSVTLCLNPARGKVNLNECPYLVRLQDAASRNRGDQP